jgi:hypothetical protein
MKNGFQQPVSVYTIPDESNVTSSMYDGQFRGVYKYSKGTGDLDQCNGVNVEGNYSYYVTNHYPWVLGCFSGTADASFAKRRPWSAILDRFLWPRDYCFLPKR